MQVYRPSGNHRGHFFNFFLWSDLRSSTWELEKQKLSACHSLLFHTRGSAEQTTLDNSELKNKMQAGVSQLPNRKDLLSWKNHLQATATNMWWNQRKRIMRIVKRKREERGGGGRERKRTSLGNKLLQRDKKNANTKLSCWPRLYQPSHNTMDRAAESRWLHQYKSFPKFLVAEQLLVASTSWNCFPEAKTVNSTRNTKTIPISSSRNQFSKSRSTSEETSP